MVYFKNGGEYMRKANLGDSTIIMFKDIYRYGKRMSRPNYWWGMLGLTIDIFEHYNGRVT